MKIVLFFFAATAIALADVAPPKQKAAKETAAAADTTSGNVEANDGVQIYAGTEDSKVTIKSSYTIEEGDNGTDVSISAAAPLDKKNDYTQIRTFDGFANSFSFSSGVTFNHYDFPNGTPWFWGLTGSVGYNKYTFTDTTSLDETKVSKIPWGAGSFWATALGKDATCLLLGAEYKDSFKEQDSKGVTLAPDSNGRVFIRTGPYGTPSRKREELLSVEIRHEFSKSFAGGLKITFDCKSHEYGIDLPLMFISGEKDARWTGGIQVGYNSKDHRGYGAVVVGSPFKIFPK